LSTHSARWVGKKRDSLARKPDGRKNAPSTDMALWAVWRVFSFSREKNMAGEQDILREIEKESQKRVREREEEMKAFARDVNDALLRELSRPIPIASKEDFLGEVTHDLPGEKEYRKRCEEQMRELFRKA
jgi:hypothetical protein